VGGAVVTGLTWLAAVSGAGIDRMASRLWHPPNKQISPAHPIMRGAFVDRVAVSIVSRNLPSRLRLPQSS
jgi:hypothetical protein